MPRPGTRCPSGESISAYPFPLDGEELDFRPLLEAVIADRRHGRRVSEIAGGFHEAVARTVRDAGVALSAAHGLDTIVFSGGVFQNALLMERVRDLFPESDDGPQVWVNRKVPPNDGGISLGQAAWGARHIE